MAEFTLSHITPDIWNNNVGKCRQFIELDSNWKSIPLLNYIPPENIKDKQLLRFQGMIQNMYNPEFFLSQYEVSNIATGKTSVVCGKLKDTVECKENERFVEDSEHNENSEREVWLCVPVPALNDWVTSNWKKSYLKRHHSDLPEEMCGSSKKAFTENLACPENSDNSPDTSSIITLPDPQNRKFYLKLYDFDTSPYALNDVVEVVGFLSLMEDIDDDEGFSLPRSSTESSKIPNFHVVCCKKLPPSHSFLPEVTLENDVQSVRKDLLLVFSQLLLGDTLAADYLLCHLLSSVYSRTDMTPLGQLPLNIFNIPKNDYAKKLYEVLALLVEKSVYFPMSLENLNEKTMTPKKNYENDELSYGLLQLSPHTHFILDETQMQPGKLENLGVLNMAALRKLVVEQKVAYDFQYHHLDFNSDFPILILSEGKSLLPCSVILPLESEVSCVESCSEVFQAVHHFLQPSILDRMRAYLLRVRLSTFMIGEEMEKVIQEDFVKMRQNKDMKTSAEDLHNLMILARLLSLSMGEDKLNAKTWEYALSLETQRKQRLTRGNSSRV